VYYGIPTVYRSIFISDFHLGNPASNATILADFLATSSCHHLFLLGNVLDGMSLRKAWYWDDSHDRVLKQIVSSCRAGTTTTYLPGRHDAMLRNWLPLGSNISGIRMTRETTHITADGRHLLVIHGDEFAGVIRRDKFRPMLTHWAYDAIASLLGSWPLSFGRYLSVWLKRWGITNRLVVSSDDIERFRTALTQEARRRGFDGVVWLCAPRRDL
jgi:UDP-2,3-diacylglucosamine pyrophosphatase LpxH